MVNLLQACAVFAGNLKFKIFEISIWGSQIILFKYFEDSSAFRPFPGQIFFRVQLNARSKAKPFSVASGRNLFPVASATEHVHLTVWTCSVWMANFGLQNVCSKNCSRENVDRAAVVFEMVHFYRFLSRFIIVTIDYQFLDSLDFFGALPERVTNERSPFVPSCCANCLSPN